MTKKMTKWSVTVILISLLTIVAVSCNRQEQYAPKPKGYLRFEFPEKQYAEYDTAILPFRFEAGSDAVVEVKRNERRLKWVDIKYPAYSGIIYLSYIPLSSPRELAGEVDTSYQLLSKHFTFASGQKEFRFVNPTDRVFATTYKIEGRNVASTYQFWATDSVRHFLRGSLYLDCVPNNDSLSPIINYLQADLDHLLETLQWK